MSPLIVYNGMPQGAQDDGLNTTESGIIVPLDGYWNANPWSEQVCMGWDGTHVGARYRYVISLVF